MENEFSGFNDFGISDESLDNSLFESSIFTSDDVKPITPTDDLSIDHQEPTDTENDDLKIDLDKTDIINEETVKPVDPDGKVAEEEAEVEEPLYATLTKDFVRLGVFGESDEELPQTEEEFLERSKNEQMRGANAQLTSFLNRFGKDYMDAFQAIFVNGVDPKEYYKTSSESGDVFSLDMEQEANQKKVIKKYYTDVLKMPENRAERTLKGVEEDGELDSEALSAIEEFKKIRDTKLADLENSKIQAEQAKANERKLFNQHVTTFLNTKVQAKDIDGLKFNEDVSYNIQKSMTTHAYKLPNGELITDFQKFMMDLAQPENIEIAVKIALLRENNFDFSKIQAKKTTLEKDKLFSTLKRTTQQKPNTQKSKDFFTI